jgi:hypothetical protein
MAPQHDDFKTVQFADVVRFSIDNGVRVYMVSFVLTRLAKFVLVLALSGSIGLHWAFFQSLAWTSMLADHLGRDSLAQAVEITFDGQHPCSLCKAIAAGKKSEKKNESAPRTKTLEFPPAPQNPALIGPPGLALDPPGDLFSDSLATAPPTPPPRAVIA